MKIRVSENMVFPSGKKILRYLEILDTEKMEDLITLLHIGDTSNTNNIIIEQLE